MISAPSTHEMEDIFGQLPRLKGYTHLALCFRYSDDLSQENLVTALEFATDRITSSLPWIAGSVINHGAGPGCSGTFTVTQPPDTTTILKIQRRSDVCPSYKDITQVQGASDLLDVTLLSAETSLPESYTESEDDSSPVLTLTASWIKGGIVLDCAAQHNILDMGGMNQFFKLLATALQGKPFDRAAIEANTCDRMSLFSLLRSDEARYDLSHMRRASSLKKSLRSSPTDPSPSFHYFRFNATALDYLRALAQTPSIDDALSAFIWKRLGTVRLKQGHAPDTITGFSRAIDCRRALDIPDEYMGVAVVKTYTTMSFDELHQSSLHTVGARLRKDVRKIGDRRFLQSLATLIAEEPDKSTINFVKDFDHETWINASSWANVSVYALDFGPLGKPAVVRRPKSKPVQSLLYFMPRMESGDIDVLLCLRDDEIRGLKSDLEWSRHSTYIG